MDLIDKRIIAELASNCRLSYRHLGKMLDISATTVQRRVAKLRDIGLFSRPYVILSLAMLEAEYCWVDVETDASEKDETIITEFGVNPNVMAVARMGPRRFFIIAEVSGAAGLYELGKFFRGFPCVQDIMIQFIQPLSATPSVHLPFTQKYVYLGRKIDLTKHHLAILEHLIHDAKMPATEIAKLTPYSSRRAQKIIQELQTSGAFYFITFLRFSAASIVPFWLNIVFDENKVAPHEVVEWVQGKIPMEYWNAFLFSQEPRVLHFCTTKDIQTLAAITNTLKDAPFAKRVETYVLQPQSHFVGRGYIRLAEMLGMKVKNHVVEYYTD
ncbi:MAG: Lrp/AsnC family transcriptional regulator [Candidatus Thorarchaeota archaeon]